MAGRAACVLLLLPLLLPLLHFCEIDDACVFLSTIPILSSSLRCSCLDLATPTSRPRHHTTPGPWVAEQLHTLNDFRRTKAKTETNAGVAVNAEGSTDTSTDFKDGIVVVRYLLGTVGFDESGESQWSVVRGQGYDQCRGRGQGFSVWSVPNSNL